MQVEEGFLGGLDLAFADGLNVLIGPRGSGKTSVIELIRYALDIEPHTEEIAARHWAQVRGVLEAGRVTLNLESGGRELTVTRAGDDSPVWSEVTSDRLPLVLSQGEIEAVATDAVGRLRLIDEFVAGGSTDQDDERLVADISAISTELSTLGSQIAQFDDRLAATAGLAREFKAARQEQTEVTTRLDSTGKSRKDLEAIAKRLASIASRRSAYSATRDSIGATLRRMTAIPLAPTLVEVWPASADSEDLLAAVRLDVQTSQRHLDAAIESLRHGLEQLDDLDQANQAAEIDLQDRNRELRRQLESLEAGASVVSQRVTRLQTQVGQRRAWQESRKSRLAQMKELQERRDRLLDDLDHAREERFSARSETSTYLNELLGPRVRVTIRRYGQPVGYANALSAALRGSGLQHNPLATQIAERLSPRELALAVDAGNTKELASLAEITDARASKVIEHLRGQGMGAVLSAPIEDDAELALLDGGAYKSITDLSPGQQCTIVLPILLAHREAVVVLDQPEDNLDNAFVVDTVVHVLRDRARTGQSILATHNANIPVLGDASRVIVMQSTGSHGFFSTAAPLDDADVVASITSVMEGGKEAFTRRAEFYAAEHRRE